MNVQLNRFLMCGFLAWIFFSANLCAVVMTNDKSHSIDIPEKHINEQKQDGIYRQRLVTRDSVLGWWIRPDGRVFSEQEYEYLSWSANRNKPESLIESVQLMSERKIAAGIWQGCVFWIKLTKWFYVPDVQRKQRFVPVAVELAHDAKLRPHEKRFNLEMAGIPAQFYTKPSFQMNEAVTKKQ